MNLEDTYGLNADDLFSAERTAAAALNCAFRLCENDSRGGDYFRFDDESGRNLYLLQENFVPDEDAWVEPMHQDLKFVLYTNFEDMEKREVARRKLVEGGAQLLRSRPG
jgi:hypothetical protein